MAEFDSWAAYYDYLHPGLPGEAEFYGGQALRRGGPVLEAGCGTGRLAILMAMSGLKVTGVDNSAAMLAVCAQPNATLAQVYAAGYTRVDLAWDTARGQGPVCTPA